MSSKQQDPKSPTSGSPILKDNAKPQTHSLLQTVVAWIGGQLATVLGAAILSVIAAVGFWLSPLKDIVLQRLYPEKAEIKLIADRASVSRGEPVQLQLQAIQRSQFPVGKGIARLYYDEKVLSLSPGSSDTMNTGEITGASLLEGRFLLFPEESRATSTELHATLETKYGTYTSEPITVHILPSAEITAPYIEGRDAKGLNLSGNWHIEIGGNNGLMKILQDAKDNITGTYSIEAATGPLQSTIDGYKDGTSFKVFFHRDTNDTRKWRIDSNFSINQGDQRFIEIKGCAYLITRDLTITDDSPAASELSCTTARNYVGWKGSGASTFYATAHMRR